MTANSEHNLSDSVQEEMIFLANPKNVNFILRKRITPVSSLPQFTRLGLVIALIGVIIGIALLQNDLRRGALIAYGSTGKGHITALRPEDSNRRRSDKFYMRYVYHITGDVQLTGTLQISAARYGDAYVGELIEVKFNIADPAEHIVIGQYADEAAENDGVWISILFGSAGSLMLMWAFERWLVQGQLVRSGKLVKGQVISFEYSTYKGTTLQIKYHFTVPDTGIQVVANNNIERHDLRRQLIALDNKETPERLPLPLPYTGATVIILYASSRNYRML